MSKDSHYLIYMQEKKQIIYQIYLEHLWKITIFATSNDLIKIITF